MKVNKSPFTSGCAINASFFGGHVFAREVGRVFDDGSFLLLGGLRTQKWFPEKQGRRWIAKRRPEVYDPAATVFLATSIRRKSTAVPADKAATAQSD